MSSTYTNERVESQIAWRSAKRGIVSRPMELPHLALKLDTQLRETFGQYLDADRTPPILAWSVRVDLPKEPHLFYWESRLPENLKESDRKPFEQGVHMLTEYATNYATRFFLENSMRMPVTKQIIAKYGQVMDNISYASFHKNTYDVLHKVEQSAIARGQDYRQALFTALFKHDFSGLNDLISQAGIEGCTNINELAIYLGQNTQDNSLMTRLDASMPIRDEDSEITRQFKATTRSFWLAGLARTPGVIEVCLGNSTAVGLGAAVASLRMNPTSIESALVAGVATFAGISSFTFFSALHEAIHELSASDDYFGLQPVSLRRRERRAKGLGDN